MLKCPLCDYESKHFSSLKKHFVRHLNGVCPVCGLKTRNICIHAYHTSKYCEYHRALYYLVSKKSVDDISMFEKGIKFGKYKCHEDGRVFISVYEGIVLLRTSNNIFVTTLEDIKKIKESGLVKDIMLEVGVVDWYVGKGIQKLLKLLNILKQI